jgi:hypothetical protein
VPDSINILMAIDHDDYHAEHVGHTADGRQFFLTTPFDPGSGQKSGNEFVALYLFDSAGMLIEALIDAFGPRASMDADARRALRDQRLTDLGQVTYDRIVVAPFEVERFGLTFGLVYRKLGDDEDVAAVEAMPGNYMAFFEPWDDGGYDT